MTRFVKIVRNVFLQRPVYLQVIKQYMIGTKSFEFVCHT